MNTEILKYPINLIGYRDSIKGDVITKEGEVIGTWAVSDDDHEFLLFFAEGSDTLEFENPHLGYFLAQISDWHQNSTKLDPLVKQT